MSERHGAPGTDRQSAHYLISWYYAWGGAAGQDHPVGAGQDAGDGALEPGIVAGEAVMLGEHPEDPAVMLVVTPSLIPSRAVEHAVLAREAAGERHRVSPARRGACHRR
mgnify:CR=1 FL=1